MVFEYNCAQINIYLSVSKYQSAWWILMRWILVSVAFKRGQVSFDVQCNAVIAPLRKAASYEPRITILGIWGDTWLTRGKHGIYVAVRSSYGALTGST